MTYFNKRIVCAANRYAGTIIVCGARHYDRSMHTVLKYLPEDSRNSEEQGFINTWGEFLDREEAWTVACYNEQVIRLVGSQTEYDMTSFMDSGAELFSENLY